MKFNPGFDIQPAFNPSGFIYGPDCFGPPVENRSLDSIRKSLLEPGCSGPDPVYSIAMDVGKTKDWPLLRKMNLLFGAVIYAAGRLGKEPVRSQGHVHRKTRTNRLPPPEVYEIWNGKAIVYMQESAGDDPGRCYAVEADPGEVVIVPPGWAHATISADQSEQLVFGAWCDRDYAFDYDQVRAHHGLAWLPVFNANNMISWKSNKNYLYRRLTVKKPGNYQNLGLVRGTSIYRLFELNPALFSFVPDPALKIHIWEKFIP